MTERTHTIVTNGDLLKKLESIDNELKGIKRRNEEYQLNEKKRKVGEDQEKENSVDNKTETHIYKNFVMKHVFKNVLSLKCEEKIYSQEEEHFGALWRMRISRKGDHLEFDTSCSIPTKTDEWSIEVDTKVKLSSNCGNDKIHDSVDVYSEGITSLGWGEYLKWDELEEYLIDGNLEFEVTMKIKKVTGLYGKKLREFDETNEEFSDVILNVNGVKFYVSKLTLASHSSFFKSMFLGQFDDSKKSEITLSGIDSDDFQKYLEILYFHDPIDEFNVEGILLIAYTYKTQIVVQKCEHYLLNKSEKSLKTKLEIAVRYNLKELKCGPTISKSFVLKHVFKNVLSMEDGKKVYSEKEEHFGALWNMYISRSGNHLTYYTSCSIPNKTDEWSIEVDTEVKLFSNFGNDRINNDSTDVYSNEEDNAHCGWSEYLKWDEMEEYLIDGDLEFEVAHNIKKETGLYGKKLRDFDETNEECSDVILNVNGVKFYVSKLTLASHSSFFKSMVFDDSKKSEITLSGIDSDDFQKYLEILYFIDPIDEFNVEGILLIAYTYKTQIVVQKCEQYLLNKSEKSLKTKLEMAFRYNLKEVKKNILSKINTHDDIRKVLPENIQNMDHLIMAELFEKSLSSK